MNRKHTLVTMLAVLAVVTCSDRPEVPATSETPTSPDGVGAAATVDKLAPASADLCPQCPKLWGDLDIVARWEAINSPQKIGRQHAWLKEWRDMEALHGPESPEALYPRELLLRELRAAELGVEELLTVSPKRYSFIRFADETFDESYAETAERLRGWLDR